MQFTRPPWLSPHLLVLGVFTVVLLFVIGIAQFLRSPEAELAEKMQFQSNEWQTLTANVAAKTDHQVKTSLNERGIVFDVVGEVRDGQAHLSIRGRNPGDTLIVIIDADSDQHPESVRFVPEDGNGVRDVQLENMSREEASQFLLAWSLGWRTIASEAGTLSP